MIRCYIKNGECGAEKAFKIIGGKWKSKILYFCNLHGGITYTELKRSLQGITDTTLSRQLGKLISDGVLERIDCEKTVYKATEMADDILPTMIRMDELAYLCGYESSGMDSSIEYIAKRIGSKWKARIIWSICIHKKIRFNALQNSIEGISHKILAEQLDDLITYGFVSKRDYMEKNPHTEYSLTENGKLAYFIIYYLSEWCSTYDLIHAEVTIN